MSIEQSIIHAKEVAEEKYKEGVRCYANSGDEENDEKNDVCFRCAKEHEQLAEWLEELKQYQAIGTPDQCASYKYMIDDETFQDAMIEKIGRGIVEELNEYKTIGTVEEFLAATEKQTEKSPIIWGDDVYDDEGNIMYDMWDCPNCGKTYEVDLDRYAYCPNCGQHIMQR